MRDILPARATIEMREKSPRRRRWRLNFRGWFWLIMLSILFAFWAWVLKTIFLLIEILLNRG